MYSFNNKQQTKKRSLYSSIIVQMWKLRGVEVLLYESRVDRLFLLTHMSVQIYVKKVFIKALKGTQQHQQAI